MDSLLPCRLGLPVTSPRVSLRMFRRGSLPVCLQTIHRDSRLTSRLVSLRDSLQVSQRQFRQADLRHHRVANLQGYLRGSQARFPPINPQGKRQTSPRVNRQRGPLDYPAHNLH